MCVTIQCIHAQTKVHIRLNTAIGIALASKGYCTELPAHGPVICYTTDALNVSTCTILKLPFG